MISTINIRIQKTLQIIVIILLSSSVSCKKHSPYNENIINIEPPLINTENVLKLSEVVDSLTYIKLETDSCCLIGHIDKLISQDDKFILVDKDKATAIYIFDKTGKFINKIGTKGKGPGEYISLTDITIDEHGNIIVYDNKQDKLIIYSSEGDLKHEYRLKFDAEATAYLMNNRIAFYCDFINNPSLLKNSQYPNLIIYNLNSQEIELTGLYFDHNINRQETIGLINNFSNIKNLPIFLMIPLNDTIYQINHNNIDKIYDFNLGSYSQEAQHAYQKKITKNTIDVMDANKEFTEANYGILLNYMFCKDLIYTYYKKGNNYYYGFYYPNKKIFKESCVKNNSLSSYKIPIKNDFDDISFFMPISTDDENIYYILEPYLLEGKTNIANAQLNAISQKTTVEDNPIIVRAKIKTEI